MCKKKQAGNSRGPNVWMRLPESVGIRRCYEQAGGARDGSRACLVQGAVQRNDGDQHSGFTWIKNARGRDLKAARQGPTNRGQEGPNARSLQVLQVLQVPWWCRLV
jgi:hypothetical protein